MLLLGVACRVVAGCADTVRFVTKDQDLPGSVSRHLHVPAGPGPFPAVVMLHGGTGLEPYQRDWAAFPASAGYVALAVDSQRWSGVPGPGTMMGDGLGATDYLRTLPIVDAGSIALMGFSRGGAAVLDIVGEPSGRASPRTTFKAAVVLYPLCAHLRSGTAVPLLLLLGGQDTVARPEQCLETARSLQASGSRLVRWVLYPGAHHAFDNPCIVGVVRYLHGTVAHDAGALADSRQQVLRFLGERLQRPR
jgi:dienelactone hydrolase